MLKTIIEEVNKFKKRIHNGDNKNVEIIVDGKTLKGVISKSEESDDLYEKKMSSKEKRYVKKYTKTSTAKKAKKLKSKCLVKFGNKVRNSNGKLTCGSDGKVTKGMDKTKKRAMIKARKKH